MPGIGVQDIRSRRLVLHRAYLVANTSTVLYTVPTNTTVLVTNIVLANSSAAAQTATIALDGIPLVPTVQVPANSVATFDIAQALTTGKTITGGSSAGSAITCHISGEAVT